MAQRLPKLLIDERFERFSKHRSIVDLQQTLEICTLYEDSANFFKMNALRRQNSRPKQTFERWTPRTHESSCELVRQKAPQSEANVCRHKCNLQKPRLLIAQDTQECTEHPTEIRVACSCLERKYFFIHRQFIIWLQWNLKLRDGLLHLVCKGR